MRTFALVFLFVFALAAEAPIALMKQSTVLVAAQSERGGGTGSGFVVGDRLVVTNWHVCCRTEGETLTIVTETKTQSRARVLWQSKAKDLAVLEAESPLGKPKVTFSIRPQLRDGQTVWAIGYPGAAMKKSGKEGVFIATITQGIISKFFESAQGEQTNAERMIQTTAAANPGNSGGPLFDDCGRVIGINTAKALVRVLTADGRDERVPLADGINWAIESQELLDEMAKLKIPVEIAKNKCVVDALPVSTGVPPWMVGAQVGTAMIALAAVGVAARRRVRESKTRQTAAITAPVLRGISGYYSGQALPLHEKPLVLGRDRQSCQLVYPQDSTGISNRHCQLRFDAKVAKVWLEDLGSSNGTFLASGSRCQPGKPRMLAPGDRFYLATQANLFEITEGHR